MRLLIVDDYPAMRAGLRSILSGVVPAIEHIQEVSCGTDALRVLKDDTTLDTVLVDCSGVELSSEIKRFHPEIDIICYSGSADEHVIAAAIRAGVSAVVGKREAPAAIIAAVQAVEQSETYLSPLTSQALMTSVASGKPLETGMTSPLSVGENEVLWLLATGMLNKQIADSLKVTVNTVKTMRGRLYRKLRATNTAEALLAARRCGLLAKDSLSCLGCPFLPAQRVSKG